MVKLIYFNLKINNTTLKIGLYLDKLFHFIPFSSRRKRIKRNRKLLRLEVLRIMSSFDEKDKPILVTL